MKPAARQFDVRSPRFARRGFALVLVLIIMCVLALVAVAYLSSMSQERATANAFANKARAEQSAQAGVDTAMGVLRDYFKAFPDSATAWDTTQSTNADGSTNEGTTLYLRAVSTNTSDANLDLPDPAPGAASDPTTYGNADYIHGNGPNNVDATTGADNRKTFVLPLVSGATVKRLEDKANAIREPDDTSNPPRSLKATNSASPSNSVNLNTRRSLTDTTGWLGTPPGYTNPTNAALPKPFVVPWVEIKQQDGVAAGSNGPVVGRYAFWVEDESFRANVSCADGRTDAGGNFQPNDTRRDNVVNALLNPTDVSLLGLFTLIGSADPMAARTNLLTARGAYPGKGFPEARAFAHAAGLTTDNINQLQYLTTSQSSGLDLTRHGTQRLNLNTAVSSTTAPNDSTTIQSEVDRIVQTLQFHAPNFGQRFFRIVPGNSAGTVSAAVSSGSVTDPRVLNQMAVSHDPSAAVSPGNYAKIYFYKVAANVRDYIDTDAFPTCILDSGLVRPPGPPSIPFGDSGDNPVWAIGKDSAPFISECAARYRATITGNSFDMFIDYYIEVWNMTGKDVLGTDLGPNVFIRISNPTRWEVNNSKAYTAGTTPTATFSSGADLISDDADGVSPSSTRPTVTSRDYKIDVSGVTFPAGQMTVITTDPSFSAVIPPATEAYKHIVQCPWISPGKSEYKGHFPPGRSAAGMDVLDMVFDTNPSYGGGSATASADYETDITFGSDYGYIDCLQGALPLTISGGFTHIQIPYSGTSVNYPTFFGGELRGNWTNTSTATSEGFQSAALGDPRTNNEQLTYSLNASNVIEQSRFSSYGIITGGNGLTPTPTSPATGIIQTLGLPNYRTVRPNRPENPWPDLPPYYSNPNTPAVSELVLTADKAPMVIANAALTSIGQLGDIFDPSRQIDGGAYTGSRGGGRNFKIGQHDDRWDGDEMSASRSWAAWRLTDIFSTADVMEQPGLININGILRDNGAALRAALSGLSFQAAPLGDPTLHPSTGPSADLNVDQLIAELKARLSQSYLDATGTINTGGNVQTTAGTYPLQTGAGPFWERGELSELRGFGRSPDPTKASGTTAPSSVTKYTQPPAYTAPPSPAEPAVFATGGTTIDPSSQIFGRGREELFRRLVEMTTTRGNVFTIYALGQAISESDPGNASSRKVTASQQLKVTFRLVPKNKPLIGTGNSTDFRPATDYSTFDPNDPTSLHNRFGKPDHYDIEVLSVSSSNT